MATFEEVVNDQKRIGEAIQRLISNFKKDSPDRKKSKEYFEERLHRLSSQWDIFEENDNKLRTLTNQPLEQEYFTSGYYEKLNDLSSNHIQLFQDEIKRLEKEDSTTGNEKDMSFSTKQPQAAKTIPKIMFPQAGTDASNFQQSVSQEATNLIKMIRRQRATLNSLNRLLDGLTKDPGDQSQYHEVNLQQINKLWQEIEEINYSLWENCEQPSDLGYNFEEYMACESRVHATRIQLSTTTNAVPRSTCVASEETLRLPRVAIPQFDGDFLKWRQFYELFSQIVDQQALPKIHKMWYLKTNLSGEAEKLIRHLSLTQDNYDVAWDMLRDRYNNKRVLCSTLIQRMLGQEFSASSVSSIKNLHDTTQECLMSLENLGITTSSWDPLLLHLLVKKLDRSTHIRYEQFLKNPKELPKIKDFLIFLEAQFQSLEAVNNKDRQGSARSYVSAISTNQYSQYECNVCKSGTHPLFACKTFLLLKPAERLQVVKNNKRCVNCLKEGHAASSCESRKCTRCNKTHNTLLHLDKQDNLKISSTSSNNQKATSARSARSSLSACSKPKAMSTKPISSSSSNNQGNMILSSGNAPTSSSNNTGSMPVSLSAAHRSICNKYVMLSTVRIHLITNSGRELECRAVLDSGSQVNLATERLVKKLGLQQKHSSLIIEGIGANKRNCQARINVTMRSLLNGFESRLEAFVLPKIVNDQPSQLIDASSWNIPSNLPLADPTFHQPGPIDVLLGAEFFYQTLSIGQIRLSDKLPTLQNTVFGWVISGRIEETNTISATCGIFSADEETTNGLLEKFWKLEEVENTKQHFSAAEKRCEAHFSHNTRRTSEGRFVVKIPFTDNPSTLGESRQLALNRFLALERRLAKNPEIKQSYVNFMDEYELLGHMSEVSSKDISRKQCYVIPYHCVIKPDSSTTKLRVVFDASAKTSTGLSLNDIMHTGPIIQNELFSILLRFRLPKYVFTTDIHKMYRQIVIDPQDRMYHIIIWRKHPEAEIKYYQLNTVTYGTRAAPYLAIKCLLQLAKENRLAYPLGAAALDNNFYVDDGLLGSDSLTSAVLLQKEVTTILKSAGFELRKWCANHPQLLQGIPADQKEIDLDFDEDSRDSIKTLGLTWLPKNDAFCIKAKTIFNSTTRVSKRSVSSDLARIFDPLGILAPVVINAKIFMQDLWKLKVAWDEALPAELHSKWITFRNQLQEVNDKQIPRHVFNGTVPDSCQLHIFTDASEKAYGAVAYIRSTTKDGRVTTRLLCAKSRVAPINRQHQTIARLELCAALLGAQLATRIQQDIQYGSESTYFWTDSEVVLSWINAEASSYEVFVANRIAKIQDCSIAQQWRHVSSKQNPADVLSRGCDPRTFKQYDLWFYGPFFLHGKESVWPQPFCTNKFKPTEEGKRKAQMSLITARSEAENMIYSINHGNSFKRLQRILGFMIRFGEHTRGARKNHQTSWMLTPLELDKALKVIVRTMQTADFSSEILALKKKGVVSTSSSIHNLKPFLDNDGILRVGGRLDVSTLPYENKHQMLIPYNDPITKLLMQKIHEDHMHCGPTALIAHTKQRFWPIKAASMARSIVHHCVRCYRARPQLLQQVMGNLPATRITPARPFINAGVDYCGPFWIHYKLRGKRPTKAYLAIFCCFATKAVHMELVSDLTTNAFIGALKRFISRRGRCQNLYCDNATNFIGAKNQLSELSAAIHSANAQDMIMKTCNERGTHFHFIPPRAPHFGGLWEAAVKSAKHLLLRSVASASLTYEELETIIVEIEAILNSRPISLMSNDPNDLSALTPGHFLIGEPLTTQVDARSVEPKVSLGTRWKAVSQIKHEFWQRWSRDYLNELQYRNKWREQANNIKPGTVVIIREDNAPVLQWPLGRVTRTYKGDDDVVRVVDVKTESGIFKRPIHRLAPLPIEDNKSDISVDVGLINSRSPNNHDDEETDVVRKKRKHSSNNLVSVLLIAMLTLPLVMANGVKNIEFADDLGMHFEGIGTIKTSRTKWQLIVYYDLESYWEEAKSFSNGTAALQQLCQELKQMGACKTVVSTLKHFEDGLNEENNLLTIKRNKRHTANPSAVNRTRRGALNIVGNIASSLFGVLDSDYADQMVKTIEIVKQNEGHLQLLLKNQTSILDSTIHIFKQDQTAIKNKFNDIDAHLNEIWSKVHEIKDTNYQYQRFQIFNSLAMQLTIIAANLQRIQTSIIDVLTDTHHGKISPILLSPNQLQEELVKIRNYLPSTLQLPFEHDERFIS